MLSIVPLLLGCDGGQTHACDDGSITCESSMVLELADPRPAFDLHVADELGLDLDLTCPWEQTGQYVVDGVTITCGTGQVTLEQFGSFGVEITVQLEEGLPKTYPADWQIGGDFCGNPCTLGTILL
ncbi:MAG: hypothetical protein KC621_30030 [Myxococcales bacterium]|nr:hypothetical protein [Myxococcales bacterium]